MDYEEYILMLKNDVSKVKETQRLLDERLLEIIEHNKMISNQLEKIHSETVIPRNRVMRLILNGITIFFTVALTTLGVVIGVLMI
jgi:hypothetical protein